ncbi:MAG: menaquinone biosynthesis protein [Acidobacteriaceae bacterium]
MAAIHFLNPAPLMWDFEHEPQRTERRLRYQIGYTTPSGCAAELAAGEADIGLVPVAAHATIPSLLIVPGCAIASLDRVRSIILVVRAQQGIEGVRSVATDTSSRTSFAYTRILFEIFWKVPAVFLPHEPHLDAMLAAADAALLIGDPALLALEDKDGRAARTGEDLLYLDLAHEWHTFTGLPWVSAFWALRSGALQETGACAQQVIRDLQTSRDHGIAHVEDLVQEWSGRITVPRDTIRFYLTKNIHYLLDEDCLRGLDAFYRLAAECGALPRASALTLL